MKNLIVYYSFTKNNEKIAEYFRNQLSCHIAKIETVRKRSGLSILFDLMFNRKPAVKAIPFYLWNYEHVIFIAPIWAGKIAMPLKTFLLNEKANIKKYSFVTVCGGGNASQKAKVEKQLIELTGKVPEKVVELWVSNLLPIQKQGTVKSVTGYRIQPADFAQFDQQIQEILEDNELVEK
jgi:flavodoxin